MGNICRSPTAHGVFQRFVDDAGRAAEFVVTSAGTIAAHVGEPPDPRTRKHAKARGYDLSPIRARHVSREMIAEADLVLAMDLANLRSLQAIAAPGDRAKLRRFLEFAVNSGHSDVPDPYYGGADGFELVLDLCEAASRGLLEELRRS